MTSEERSHEFEISRQSKTWDMSQDFEMSNQSERDIRGEGSEDSEISHQSKQSMRGEK